MKIHPAKNKVCLLCLLDLFTPVFFSTIIYAYWNMFFVKQKGSNNKASRRGEGQEIKGVFVILSYTPTPAFVNTFLFLKTSCRHFMTRYFVSDVILPPPSNFYVCNTPSSRNTEYRIPFAIPPPSPSDTVCNNTTPPSQVKI